MDRREHGLTLVDTTIAAVVVVLIVGLAYPGFQLANDTIAASGYRDRMERSGDRMLRAILEEIRSGQITGFVLPPEAPALTIVRPRTGVELSELDADGNVPWGSTARIIRFRQVDTVAESDADEDLNRDGDRLDSFAIGLIEVVEGGVARPVTTGGKVILGLPTYRKDLDGDGDDDPLFTVEGRDVEVRIHLLTRTESGQYATAAVRGGLHLRNTQH